MPGSLIKNQKDVVVLRSSSVFGKIVENNLKSLGIALRENVPNRFSGLRLNKGEEVKPLILDLYLDNGTLTLGSPDTL